MGPGFLNIKKVSSLKDVRSWLERDREAPSVVDKKVEAILKDIRLKGDPAVLRMVKKFDGFEAKNIKDITEKKHIEQAIMIYNTKRPHLSCSMLTPAEMHQQNVLPVKYWEKTSLLRREVH